jgi:hypothetical protein
MRAFLKAVAVGGFVVVSSAFVADVGSAQAPAATPPPAAATPPAAPPVDAATAAADAKADPDCKPAQIACGWSNCYPINQTKYPSLTACVLKNCNVSDECKSQLVQDIFDPDREQSRGGGK